MDTIKLLRASELELHRWAGFTDQAYTPCLLQILKFHHKGVTKNAHFTLPL